MSAKFDARQRTRAFHPVKRRRARLVRLRRVLACSLIAGAAPASAQPNEVDLRATLSAALAIELDDGAVQKSEVVLEPVLEAPIRDFGKLTARVRLRLDPADRLEPGQPNGQEFVRSVVSRRAFIGDAADFEFRELYVDAEIGAAFLRLGKQQVVWGEADGLRVLDVVNPLNFREFILPDFEDRRIPTFMANLEVPVGALSAQFLWIPDHTYDEIPEDGATFAFSSSRFVPRPPPALIGTGAVVVNAPDRPDRLFTDDDYGARITGFAAGWDFSVNYLYHYQDQPVFRRRLIPGGGLSFDPAYERTHLIGATASTAFGKFALRAEAGYSSNRFFITNDAADADGVVQSGEFSYVLGVDYMPTGDWFVSGQLFQSVIGASAAGATRDRVDTTASLLLRREMRNDTVRVEAQWLHSANDGDGLVAAKLRYDLRDDVELVFGLDVFYGDPGGLFGQFGDADRASVEVVVGF